MGPADLTEARYSNTACWLSGASTSAEIAIGKIGAVIAEQRFGAAIAGVDVAFGIEHQNAFGGGVEDGAEIFGVGVTGRRWFYCGTATGSGSRWRCHRDRRVVGGAFRADQRERRIVVPGNGVQPRRGRLRRGSAFAFLDIWLAEIVTGVPACDVLLAVETPGST